MNNLYIYGKLLLSILKAANLTIFSHTAQRIAGWMDNGYRLILEQKELKCFNNKDDNINISEALKWKDKRTLTLVKCQN